MKAFEELSRRVGNRAMTIIDVDRMVLEEFSKFKEEWPGDYELSHYYEDSGTKLVIGIRFKSVQDKHWAEIRWS